MLMLLVLLLLATDDVPGARATGTAAGARPANQEDARSDACSSERTEHAGANTSPANRLEHNGRAPLLTSLGAQAKEMKGTTMNIDPRDEVELTPTMVLEAVSTLYTALVLELDEKGLISRSDLGQRLLDSAAANEGDDSAKAIVGTLRGIGSALRGTPI